MDMDLNDHESDDTNGDGEGVWSPDIEQCFREALLLFPPCGRRKHILQEEGGGKMYGRNELIARHIMMRTGKKRTRKQVSSHIQVLARRKAKAEAAAGSGGLGISPSPSAGGVRSAQATGQQQQPTSVANRNGDSEQRPGYYDVWVDRPIVTQKIRLVEFSAFIEYLNFHPVNGALVGGAASQVTTPNAVAVGGFGGQQQTASILGIPSSDSTTDLSLGGAQQQQQAAGPQTPTQTYPPNQAQQHPTTVIAQPLASNHNLPAQFNQAYQASNNNINTTTTTNNNIANNNSSQLQGGHLSVSITNNNNYHHHHHHHNHIHHLNLQQPQSSSGNFTRHSYVQIDYRQTIYRQTDKLERIDISQIQDKFPEIGGSEGLFQRGPSDAFFLVKFWADLNNDYEYNIDDQNSYFGFSSHFESIDPYKDITCSTKACSYGLQVVEKVEKIYGAFNSTNGRYSYDIDRSPMCEFMIQFIKKLRQLPRASQMNSVLENFTVLQVITSESTSEILLCLAYVFEVGSTDQTNGPQYNVYKLTKD